MFLTKKHLSRRTVLKGAGVTLALPLWMPCSGRDGAGADGRGPKLRMGFFYIPHGAIMGNTSHGPEMDRWTPSGAGADFKLSPILELARAVQAYVTSFGNLENEAMAGGVHGLAPATWLSGIGRTRGSAGASMSATLDQVVAQHIGQDTTLPSLEWPRKPPSRRPRAAARRASTTPRSRSATRIRRCRWNTTRARCSCSCSVKATRRRSGPRSRADESLLDRISDRTRALQRDLGAGDRVVLDSYLDTVREIERRVAAGLAAATCRVSTCPNAPIGELDAFDEQVDLLFDLIALAYQADLTRVASYIMVAEGTNRTYNHIGVSDSFHPVSHHANDLDRINKLVKIQTWHVERFAAFLKKLADDRRTATARCSTIRCSCTARTCRTATSTTDIRCRPSSSAAATARCAEGSTSNCRKPTPLANLHLTILDKVGIEQPTFGDSTGRIAGV